MAVLKYKDPTTGDWIELSNAVGDTLPIGAIVEYDGTEVPPNWEKIEDKSIMTNSILFYQPGETVTFGAINQRFIESGFLSSGSQSIYFDINTDKRLDNITNLTISELRLQIRHPDGGYLGSNRYYEGGQNFLTSDNVVTVAKASNNKIHIVIYKSTGFGFTNNVPLSIAVEKATFKMS